MTDHLMSRHLPPTAHAGRPNRFKASKDFFLVLGIEEGFHVEGGIAINSPFLLQRVIADSPTLRIGRRRVGHRSESYDATAMCVPLLSARKRSNAAMFPTLSNAGSFFT